MKSFCRQTLRTIGAVAILAFTAPCIAATADTPAVGVPLQLAQERARRIVQLRYQLWLSVPPSRDQPVKGTSVLRFGLSDASTPLVLDFDPGSTPDVAAEVNGKATPLIAINGHLVIPAQRLRRGENVVRLQFEAGNGPLNRGDDLLYTLFVPARARQAIPCFDQPDLKARWTLTLEHPAAWQSVGNAAEIERRHIGSERVRVRFAPTRPLPTYLLSFVAGRMHVDTARRDGRTMRMFHREDDAARLQRNRDALFDLHARSLAFLERYTGIRYPFGKFDFVLIPALQYGGMEHAGDIAYRAEDLLLDDSATQQDLLERARTVAHETAHMWFGNLVTMRWFDDVWTKEVFANFMAAKVIEPMFPALRHDLDFFLAHHRAAYEVDRSAGANPIRQPLANLAEAGSLYGPIIYAKAPVVMRQLEAVLGAEPFRRGLRDYLHRHAFANATWDDLIAALAPRGRLDLDLRAWSRAWIDEPGRPLVHTELALDGQRVERLLLTQSDARGRALVWPQQLRITLGCGDGGRRRIEAELAGASLDLSGRLGGCVPRYVLAGGEGWGYGEFELDARSAANLPSAIPRIDDALTRIVAWSALWDAMLSNHVPPMRLFDTALATLAAEPDSQVAAELLFDLGPLWWRFLSPPQRQAMAPALEQALREGLARANEQRMKAAWFRAVRSMATTPQTLDWLAALWRREAAIDGLPLSEPDETALALGLALRDVEGWRAVLDTQAERIGNPDRKARFAFIRAAASAEAAERERWFAALRDPVNRRHEPWVVEGLALLHHPLRATRSAPLVLPALEMLPEINRSGDLFFDYQWLASVLRGHSSAALAAAVTQFIEQLPPGYPPRLRMLLQQSADPLQRAARAQGG